MLPKNLFRKSSLAAFTLLTTFMLTLAIAMACTTTETVIQTVEVPVEVPGDTVIQTVVVEKEVPGETVVQTVVIEKETLVEVPGDTVVQTVLVDRPVEVRGETVVQTVVVEQTVQVTSVVEVPREVVVEVTSTPAPLPVGEIDPDAVPRNRTLIVMSGGQDGRNPDWENFNNYVPGGTGGWHAGPLQTMAEPLIMFNLLTGEYELWLAESFEVSDDFTQVTLKLRNGIKWADGMPFTAEDVAFTFNTVKQYQDELTHTAEIHLMDRAEVIDERTVRFHLLEPSPSWWVNTLTSNHGLGEHILPKHVWEDKDIREFTFYDPDQGWPFSTGPFELVSASAEQKVFVRRNDWWAAETGFKSLPEVEKVVYIPQREETARSQMIIRNEIDSMSMVPVDTLLDIFEQNPMVVSWSKQQSPYGYLDWCPIGLFVNNAGDSPVAESKDIRWALNYALNRETLVSNAERGAGTVAYHMITPYAWFNPFEELLQPIYEKHTLDTEDHYDLIDQRMAAAGYTKNDDDMWEKDGEIIEMSIGFPSWLARYGVHIVRQLQDAGFAAAMDQSPGTGEAFSRGERDYQFGCKGPSGVLGADPYYMLSLYSSATFRDIGQPPVNPWATARWRNEQFDSIVTEMSKVPATDPRTMTMFADAMDIWFEELPDIYVSQLIIRHLGNEQFWTGWPSFDNNYGVLHPWQQEFLKIVTNLKATK